MMKSLIKYMGKCTELSLLKEPEVEYITKPSKLQAFRSWLTTHIQQTFKEISQAHGTPQADSGGT